MKIIMLDRIGSPPSRFFIAFTSSMAEQRSKIRDKSRRVFALLPPVTFLSFVIRCVISVVLITRFWFHENRYKTALRLSLITAHADTYLVLETK